MIHCSVALSANAGVSVQLGNVRIWSDALHDRKVSGFSEVSPALWEQLRRWEAFAAPDLIFYTHCHPDHYSRTMTAEAKALWPQAALALPELEFSDQILLSGQDGRLDVGDVSLYFRRLTHEGAQFSRVPHYGCILCSDGFRVLIGGDGAVASPELAEFVGGEGVDLALLDFPWITLRKGRTFLERFIRPKHLVVYHLPFAADDEWGYRSAAVSAVRNLRSVSDVRLLQDPLQLERIC